MAGGMAVSDVIGFQILLQWHLFSDVSLASQMMMLVASTLSLHTLVETFLAMLTRACTIAEGCGSKLVLEDANPGSTVV